SSILLFLGKSEQYVLRHWQDCLYYQQKERKLSTGQQPCQVTSHTGFFLNNYFILKCRVMDELALWLFNILYISRNNRV
ncbi:hypothetical protein NDU88_002445, partial [Pleurodeles waltl]